MSRLAAPEIVRLGVRDYESVWRDMQAYTDQRDSDTPDQLWLVEHPAVFTLGQNGRLAHVRDPGDIPVVHVDRGGQVTYHGPGQVVMYVLLDLRRWRLGVRQLVTLLERAVIGLAAQFGLQAASRPDAPGVYLGDAKLASLGLRIRRGCSYHGVALNVDGDLTPFFRIDPCGFPGLQVTRLADHAVLPERQAIATRLANQFTLALQRHDQIHR